MSRGIRLGSLRTRIVAWSFVPAAIILTAVALVTFYAYQQVAEDLVVERNRELARLSAGQLANEIGKYRAILSEWAQSLDAAQRSPESLQTALGQDSNRFVVFDGGVFVLDWKGKLVATEPRRPDLLGQDWSERGFFRRALHTRQPVVSGVLQAPPPVVYASGSLLEEIPLVVVAVPILGGSPEQHGVVAGGFRLGATSISSLYGSIVKLHIGGQDTAYLVDVDGVVIYHADGSLIGEDLSAEGAVQRVGSEGAGAFRTRDRTGREIVASFAPVPGTPWALVIESDWRALLQSSRGYRPLLLALLALGVILPSIVVAVGVRRITRPIADLMAAAQQVAAGNLGHTVTASTGDEIEELVEQFNRMSLQLADSYSTLQAREERLALVLQATNDGIWDWDLGSGEVYYSPRWKSMLGYEEHEIGSSYEDWKRLVHPDDLSRALHAVEQEQAGLAPSFVLEHRLRHKDGSYRWILARGVTLRDAQGRPCRMIGSHSDLTRRKEAEAELRRQNEYLAALHETALGVIGRLSVTELLEAIVERAVKLVEAADGYVYLVRSEPTRLEVCVAVGWSEKDIGFCLARGEGLAGKVWDTGRPLAVENYDSWPGRSLHFEGQAIGPNMAVPLHSGAETVGVLGVARPAGVAPFAPAQMDLIERLAQLASIALDNARLHTSLQEELAERVRTERALERRLAFEKIIADVSSEFINLALDEIEPGICRALAAAGEFTGADRCYVYIFSGDGRRMTNTHEWCRAGINSVQADYQGQPLVLLPWTTERIMALEAVHVPSVAALPAEAASDRGRCLSHQPPTLSFLNVPMIYRGRAMGLLGLDAVRTEVAWDQDSLALLRMMGEIFANALEHKQAQWALQSAYQTLEQRVRERTHELATLNAIAALASRSLDLEEILRDTLEQILRTLDMKAGVAYRLERNEAGEEQFQLTPLAWRGVEQEAVRAAGSIDVRGTALEASAIHGLPLVWALDDPDFQAQAGRWPHQEGVAQVTWVPLMAKGNWVGAIYVASGKRRTFAPEQLSLLAAVGQQVGVAVENARLYQAELAGHAEAERRRQVAEGMRDIMDVLNSNRPLREILDFMVQQAGRLLGADAGFIARFDSEGHRFTLGASHAWPPDLAESGEGTLTSTRGNQALLQRQPFAIGDLPAYVQDERRRLGSQGLPASLEWQARVARHFGAVLGAPLVVRDSLYGALAMYYCQPRELADEDYRLSMILADQIAVAIENAQLRERAEQAAAIAERSRLARELHDSVTQNLYSLTLYAEAAARQMAAGQNSIAAEYLRDLSDTAQEALREMRLLIFELRPPALEKGGLVGALQARLDAVEKRGGLAVELGVTGLEDTAEDGWLPLAVQQELYHLAREALNNSLKHARAQKVQVCLQVDERHVQLSIADDGVGFDPLTAGEQGGLGLAGMQERAQRIGGQLVIESRPGATRVVARVARG
jgi:PAS domain S-box-containing protein